jgi:outer membrane immunogenic protein
MICMGRLSLLAGFTLATFATAAQAADYGSYQEPASSGWSGFYTGLFLGYGDTTVDTSEVGIGSVDINGNGLTGGIIRGFNLQSGKFVYGLEGDLGIHEFKGNGGGAGGTLDQTIDHLWSAHVRARLGYDMGRLLPFVAGGLSIGEVHNHRTSNMADGSIEELAGWTVGAGVDAKVSETILTRVEYLYENLGDATWRFTGAGRTISGDVDTHIVRAAVLLRSEGFGSVSRESLYGDTSRWSGLFAGATVGGGFGEADIRQTAGALAGNTDSYDIDGYTAGGLIGYTVDANRFLVGLEGHLSLSDLSGSVTGGPTLPQSSDIFWLGEVKAKAGYDLGRFAPFITGGYVVAQMTSQQPGVLGPAPDPLKSGFSAGVGLDIAVTETVGVRASYDYIDFGEATIAPAGVLFDYEPQAHLVRAGLTIKIGS